VESKRQNPFEKNKWKGKMPQEYINGAYCIL
jgi:hypothetical protein